MSEIQISHEDFNKYHSDGKIRLSTGFIQEFIESFGFPGHDGVVQIIKGKGDVGGQDEQRFIYRLRIHDGIFQYNVLLSAELEEQVQQDAEHLVEGAIIAITNMTAYSAAGAKPVVVVTGYKLLSRYHQILTTPGVKASSHPGNPDDHRGYKPQVIIEDVWQEAENWAHEYQENMVNPPAAKVPKRECESAESAPIHRGAAPEPARARAVPPPARKVPSKSEVHVVPITMVNPYSSNVKIFGMVTRKEEMRTFPAKNTRVFNFEVTDANGDTIRCAAFNETAESVYPNIIENGSYYISGFTVRQANKRFNNTGHDYEINLRNESVIEPGAELLAAPKLNLKRVHLGDISSQCGNMIDVLVVVERMDDEATEFTSKAGKTLVKREMDLIDESNTQVRLTIWNDEARRVKKEDYLHKVVAFKGVIPKEFNGGYSLSTGAGTRTVVVPEIPDVAHLYDWYTTVKPTADVKMISLGAGSGSGDPPRTIAGIQEMCFGRDSERGEYASVKAMVTRINPNNVLYKGCASEGCQKKVVEMEGEYRCEKCLKTTSTFKWLYMMQFELSDETGQVYVTAFGDSAMKVVGKSAQEIGQLKDEDPDEFNATFERLQFVPKMWRLRCKMETYNEEVRQKMTLYNVEDVNQDKYIENLSQLIEQLNNMEE